MNRRIPYLLKHAASGAGRSASASALVLLLAAGIWAATDPAYADSAEYAPLIAAEPGQNIDDRFEIAPIRGTAWAVRGTDIQLVSERVAERKSGGGSGMAETPVGNAASGRFARLRHSANAVERSASPRSLFYLHSALLI